MGINGPKGILGYSAHNRTGTSPSCSRPYRKARTIYFPICISLSLCVCVWLCVCKCVTHQSWMPRFYLLATFHLSYQPLLGISTFYSLPLLYSLLIIKSSCEATAPAGKINTHNRMSKNILRTSKGNGVYFRGKLCAECGGWSCYAAPAILFTILYSNPFITIKLIITASFMSSS